MHPRYILTDLGGLSYDWGLDEDPKEYTDVKLLDYEDWENKYKRWSSPNLELCTPELTITLSS